MKKQPLVLLAAALLLSANTYADKPGFGDTWSFKLGGMSQTADMTFSWNREGQPDRDLSLSDLGMDDEASTFWINAGWQFAENWGTSISYSGFSSSGTTRASGDGNFGDIEWTADAELKGNYDLDLYIWEVHWNFINNDRFDVGLGLGLHVADVGMSVDYSATGTVDGEIVEIGSGRDAADITAPLPNVLMRAGYRLGEKWYASIDGGYFALTINDIDGELISFRGGLEWRPWERFGLGVGYQYLDVNVKESKENGKVKLDMQSHGPVLFVDLGF